MVNGNQNIQILKFTKPQACSSPMVISSPHSGSFYPNDLIQATHLNRVDLRSSEDCYIDELLDSAPNLGASLIAATYPRAYIDLNREAYELDQEMFKDHLPEYINTHSIRVKDGLGTIARIVGNKKEIYARKLSWLEAQVRIKEIYQPYHQQLTQLIKEVHKKHGYCILLDFHSMPSKGLPLTDQRNAKTVDIVLGDVNGTSCSEIISDQAEKIFSDLGYSVLRNKPYSGGFITKNYGQPHLGVDAIQIEIKRNIYMDEKSLLRKPAFASLKNDLKKALEKMTQFLTNEYANNN